MGSVQAKQPMISMSQSELKKVAIFSALLFSKEEIMLAMMPDDAIQDFESAFARGRINEQYEIRKALFNEAKNGNVAAQKEWLQLRAKLELDEKRKNR